MPTSHEIMGENANEFKVLIFPARVLGSLAAGGIPAVLIFWFHGPIWLVITFLVITVVMVSLGFVMKNPKGVFDGAGMYYDKLLFRKLMHRKKRKIYMLSLIEDKEEKEIYG